MTPPVLIERTRGLLGVRGRDPVRMIQGLATADIGAVTRGRGAYTTFLTAKGKMVADARVFLRGAVESPELLLDAAPAALPPLLDHIRRFVPPLFARADDVSEAWSVLGVYGPGASRVVTTVAPAAGGGGGGGGGGGSDPPEETVVELAAAVVERAAPEAAVAERAADGSAGSDPGGDGGFAARTGITGDEGWDVFVPSGRRDAVLAVLLAGARPASPDVLEALRVAAGRPRWGTELTGDVIPLEAGLLERAISQSKGCYTGQEVIVRILHRGHVNRHLRRLVFEAGAPDPGAELFEPGNDRPRGVVTSAVANDAGALGLGYVRREVEPPADLRVGSPSGPLVRVEALD